MAAASIMLCHFSFFVSQRQKKFGLLKRCNFDISDDYIRLKMTFGHLPLFLTWSLVCDEHRELNLH